MIHIISQNIPESKAFTLDISCSSQLLSRAMYIYYHYGVLNMSPSETQKEMKHG